jgi:hypothetical protein
VGQFEIGSGGGGTSPPSGGNTDPKEQADDHADHHVTHRNPEHQPEDHTTTCRESLSHFASKS